VCGWVEPASLCDVVHPVGRCVSQPVLVSQFGEFGQLVQYLANRIIRVCEEQLTQVAPAARAQLMCERGAGDAGPRDQGAIVDVLSVNKIALSNCPAGGDMNREVMRPSLGS
jgi:hypothetical protein